MKNILLASLALLLTAPAFAQTLGEITGHVSDASGAIIPAATITLTNISNNASRSTVSTDSGDYTFPSVPPGFYNLKAEHAGFKTATTKNLEVQVQQTVRVDISTGGRPSQRVGGSVGPSRAPASGKCFCRNRR